MHTSAKFEGRAKKKRHQPVNYRFRLFLSTDNSQSTKLVDAIGRTEFSSTAPSSYLQRREVKCENVPHNGGVTLGHTYSAGCGCKIRRRRAMPEQCHPWPLNTAWLSSDGL